MNKKLKNEALNRISVTEFKEASKMPVVVVLDNIRSLNNIGSVFRTADAFLVDKIFLCGITAQPPHREINKTALGATDSVSWEYVETTLNCIEQLKKEGYFIISIEQTTHKTFLNELVVEQSKKYAFIFGNEVAGVEQEVVNNSDLVVEIPQLGTKHSLNISVSSGVVLWDVFKQLML